MPKARPQFRKTAGVGAFHTVEIGTGPSNALICEQAHRFPNRRYAAVDPAFEHYQETRRSTERFGVLTEPTTLNEFLQKMIANNWKTKNFSFRMPDPGKKAESYDFANFFWVARKVMFRGGKISFTSDSPELMSMLKRLARENGFRVGRPMEITRPEGLRTHDERSMKRAGHRIFKFTIINA